MKLQLGIILAIVVALSVTTVNTYSLYHRIFHPICSFNERPCGVSGCYNPDPKFGQSCEYGRIVCTFGFRECNKKCIRIGTPCDLCAWPEKQCGNSCFNPEHGESCTVASNICRFGQKPCGKFCYSPSSEQCFNGNLICKHSQEPCFGVSCYNLSQGQKCYNNGLICNPNEFPVNGVCKNMLG